ncbi:hypothetical protein UM590_01485 [Staphylococcus aureus]|nr:hypothetical protein UM590_01485 [Staphylococcus aureus]
MILILLLFSIKDKLFESNDLDIEGFNNKQKEDLSIDLNPFDDELNDEGRTINSQKRR